MEKLPQANDKRAGQLGLGLGLTTDRIYRPTEEPKQTKPDKAGEPHREEIIFAEGLGAMTDINSLDA